MLVAEVKDRLLRAFAKASEKHPDGAMPELVAAVRALPDETPLRRLAPEVRRLVEDALAKCPDRRPA